MNQQAIPVAVALIERAGHYLIRQRPALPGSPMPGYWEFPGGKCEPGETLAACARREIQEEAGLCIDVLRLRRVIHHEYPHARVALSFFDCQTSDPSANPDPETGFRWVPVHELPSYQFPGANEPIVEDLCREAIGP